MTNGNLGTVFGSVFIPIKQNGWKVHGNSSQQNQQATPSTGDGVAPTQIPNTQRPTANEDAATQGFKWSVENN